MSPEYLFDISSNDRVPSELSTCLLILPTIFAAEHGDVILEYASIALERARTGEQVMSPDRWRNDGLPGTGEWTPIDKCDHHTVAQTPFGPPYPHERQDPQKICHPLGRVPASAAIPLPWRP
jgi:hypothetical protein